MQNNEKTLARLAAIQTVYSGNIDDEQDLQNVLDLTIDEIKKEHGKLKKSHANKLVDIVIDNEESLENIIDKYSDKTDNLNISTLISSILQVALAELMMDEKTARKIIVSEYVNLASDFFGERETGYVNAILDRYIKD